MLEKLISILNKGKNCKVVMKLHLCDHPKPPSCFGNEPHLLANALLPSDFCQYAIFSQSSSNADFLKMFWNRYWLGLQLPEIENWITLSNISKVFLMTGLDLKGYIHRKQVKMRNKEHFTTSCISHVFIYSVFCHILYLSCSYFQAPDIMISYDK